jgi:hypothetical protein
LIGTFLFSSFIAVFDGLHKKISTSDEISFTNLFLICSTCSLCEG